MIKIKYKESSWNIRDVIDRDTLCQHWRDQTHEETRTIPSRVHIQFEVNSSVLSTNLGLFHSPEAPATETKSSAKAVASMLVTA